MFEWFSSGFKARCYSDPRIGPKHVTMAKKLPALDKLVSCLARLPGIGRRSAERMAISLIVDRNGLKRDLIDALEAAESEITCCDRCAGLTSPDENPCRLCTDPSRDDKVLCIVESQADVLLIESAGGYRGRYHVLTAKISPMNRQGPGEIRLKDLMSRLDSEPVEEIILALNSDVESDATAAFIRDMLGDRSIRISRPATGLPVGSGIAYSDAVTLAKAMKGRNLF